MDNVFGKAAGASSSRKLANKASNRFSPSYGVRKGFIKDPNWPPAQFPEEGNATMRRTQRMPATFEVKLKGGFGDEAVSVHGDISLGGAKFKFPRELVNNFCEVALKGVTAKAEVIASDGAIVRVRFTEPDEAAQLWAQVQALN